MKNTAGTSGIPSEFRVSVPQCRSGNFSQTLRWVRLGGVSLGAIAAFTSQCALAQTAAAPDGDAAGGQLEEIVVTAGKRGDVSIQKTPYNISAVGEQMLQQTGSLALEDVARLVPGLEVRGSDGDQKVIIRGLAASAGEPQVATYLDETPLPGSDELALQQPDIALYDMHRVEVLRGPQGTLYGADSEGGAIRYITNSPDLTRFDGSVNAMAGGRAWGGGSDSSFHAMANAPILPATLGVRAMGYVQHVSGLQDRPDLGFSHTDSQDRYGGRLEAELDATQTTKILATAVYQNNTADDRSYVIPGTTDTPGRVLTPFWDKLSLVNLTLRQQLGWGALTATTAYIDRLSNNILDASQTPFFPGRSFFLDNLGHNMVRFAEARFASSFSGPVQVIAGLYWQDRTVNTTTTGLFASSVTGRINSADTFYLYHQDYEFRSKAAFFNANYALTDRLSLEGGIREYNEAQGQNNLLVQSPFSTPGPTRLGSSGSNHVARGQMSYQASDDVLVYGLYSEGFRPGGPNNRILDATFPAQYQPDKVKNYEVGAKTQWLGRTLTLNASVYYMSWNDIQIMEANSVGVSYTANAGTAALKGIEIEGAFRPQALPGLAVNFSLRLSQQELTENSPTYNAITSPYSGKDGDSIPQSSKGAANMGIEQRFLLDNWHAFARVDAAYVGKAATTFTSADPNYETFGGYVLGSFKTGVIENSWTAALYARNIGSSRSNATGWYQNLVGVYDRIYQTAPFEAGLEIGYQF